VLIVFLFDESQEEIFASSFAAAAYLKSINFPSEKKVMFDYTITSIYFSEHQGPNL
jgi:hypothetical protein